LEFPMNDVSDQVAYGSKNCKHLSKSKQHAGNHTHETCRDPPA
jgi:hypothetical protein